MKMTQNLLLRRTFIERNLKLNIIKTFQKKYIQLQQQNKLK